jgi:hypothetical protein
MVNLEGFRRKRWRHNIYLLSRQLPNCNDETMKKYHAACPVYQLRFEASTSQTKVQELAAIPP